MVLVRTYCIAFSNCDSCLTLHEHAIAKLSKKGLIFFSLNGYDRKEQGQIVLGPALDICFCCLFEKKITPD